MVPTQNSISDNINNKLVNVIIAKIRNIMKLLSDDIQQGTNTKLYKWQYQQQIGKCDYFKNQKYYETFVR